MNISKERGKNNRQQNGCWVKEIRFYDEKVLSSLKEQLGSLSMQRFWVTDAHRKCTIFLFYLSWHYHIYIFKSLSASKGD